MACGVALHISRLLQFRRNFRLPRSVCDDLISGFEESVFYPDMLSRGGTPQKTAEEHILSFLWYWAYYCGMTATVYFTRSFYLTT